MKKYILLFVSFFVSCTEKIDYSKDNHWLTSKLGNNLYCEMYRVYSGGVFGGDVLTFYLTDSISFRKYLGKTIYDDQRIITELIDSNNVIVTKLESNLSNKGKILETKTYNIPLLKKERKLE